ncbi:MAG: queuosine precursor transporter [Pseudomonadota bacterium]
MTDTSSAKGAFAPYDTKNVTPINVPNGLFAFLILYGGMTVLAGVVAYKQVQLWPSPLSVEAGIFPFLLLVVISSTISQLYGRSMATRLVWWGFVPLGLSAALIYLVLGLPASPGMVEFRGEDLAAFERVLGQTPRILMAGPAAYITSLLLNIWLFDRLRGSGDATTAGLMVRGAIASALSQAIDSVIFVTLAFAGVLSAEEFTNLMIGQVIAKVTLSLVLVPFLITFGVKAATWLDQRGQAPAIAD